MKAFVLPLLTLTLLLSGCGDELKKRVSTNALCAGLEKPIDNLNLALIEDGGPKSIVAGTQVISAYDGGCKNGSMD